MNDYTYQWVKMAGGKRVVCISLALRPPPVPRWRRMSAGVDRGRQETADGCPCLPVLDLRRRLEEPTGNLTPAHALLKWNERS